MHRKLEYDQEVEILQPPSPVRIGAQDKPPSNAARIAGWKHTVTLLRSQIEPDAARWGMRRCPAHRAERWNWVRPNDSGVQLQTHQHEFRSGDDARCVRLLQRHVRRRVAR